MELEVKILSLVKLRGRPFSSFESLISRIKSSYKSQFEILNDRLIKIDNKYYSVNFVDLNWPLVQLLECQVIGNVILAHVLKYKIPLGYDSIDIDRAEIQVTFAFDTNGDFVDHKTISKLAMLGLVKEYKIFTY